MIANPAAVDTKLAKIKKDANKWASDITDKHWSAMFALCETLEEMIIHRPYASCESAYGRTMQSRTCVEAVTRSTLLLNTRTHTHERYGTKHRSTEIVQRDRF